MEEVRNQGKPPDEVHGARGALALERLSRAEDGRIAYRMKRPLPDGTTHLLFTGLELLRRVAALVPAPRANLTRFHGVFAPGAKLRPFLVPQAGAEETSVAPQAVASKEPMKEKTPRGDWAELLSSHMPSIPPIRESAEGEAK